MKRSLIALGLVGACAVAGCSGSNGKAASTKPHRTATTTTAPAFAANTKNTPGTLKDFVGAHSDATDTSCVAGDTGWIATGRVKNPTKNAAQYRIYVSFLDGVTTVGVAESDVKAPAGAAANWKATVGAAGKDLHCILRVERAAV